MTLTACERGCEEPKRAAVRHDGKVMEVCASHPVSDFASRTVQKRHSNPFFRSHQTLIFYSHHLTTLVMRFLVDLVRDLTVFACAQLAARYSNTSINVRTATNTAYFMGSVFMIHTAYQILTSPSYGTPVTTSSNVARHSAMSTSSCTCDAISRAMHHGSCKLRS